eukprot:gb/GECG01010943.1/.p1 GENE.gb/GECG01010943.1/~~gb/GECG01010943.1/.p1  ORF type:complete len:590 (+),score=59.81 gb/GECG01010943.1/:1-1770(+)
MSSTAADTATSTADAQRRDSKLEKQELRTADSSATGEHDEGHTVTSAFDEIGFGRYQWKMLILTQLIWIADAMEMMILSFLGPELKCQWDLSSSAESLLTTVVFIGMMIGTSFWGVIADRYGRKTSVLVSSLSLLLFGIGSAFAPSYAMMLFLRGVVGFGIGGIPVSFSMFMEVIPTAHRGLWAIVVESSWTFGTVFSALIAWAVLPPLGWQYLLAIATTPIFLFMIFYLNVYESPRYLVRMGDHKKAEENLRRIAEYNKKHDLANLVLRSSNTPLVSQNYAEHWYGSNGATGEPHIEEDGKESSMHEPKPSSPEEKAKPEDGAPETSTSLKMVKVSPKGKLAELKDGFMESQFVDNLKEIIVKPVEPYMRRLTLLLWFIWTAVSFGYYGIVLLTTELQLGEKGSGCKGETADFSTHDFTNIIIASTAEMPGLFIAALLIDWRKLGRRGTMAILVTICTAAFFLINVTLHNHDDSGQLALLFIGRAAILGAFQVAYLYTPEVYSTNVRSTAVGIANGWARVGGMVAPFVGQGLVASGHVVESIFVFGGVSFLGAIASVLLPVETVGKPLHDSETDEEETEEKQRGTSSH